jgi:hypothetical protein
VLLLLVAIAAVGVAPCDVSRAVDKLTGALVRERIAARWWGTSTSSIRALALVRDDAPTGYFQKGHGQTSLSIAGAQLSICWTRRKKSLD